uniref:Serotransferrin n=1 Tax=Stegastes partitus TaxID=144197 RepID=A0A3B5ANC0_9TELE
MLSTPLPPSVFGQSSITWCTISEQEQKKCNAICDTRYPGYDLCTVHGVFQRVVLWSPRSYFCSLIIRVQHQHVKQHSLYVNTAAAVSSETFSYHAVAVVKKANSAININNLAGKKTCHTGKGRTAGWNMPLGYFIDQGYMSAMGCNIPQGVANFFNASCIPGANEPEDFAKNKNVRNKNTSTWGEIELSKLPLVCFFGLCRCLVEDAGQVAFIKHTTVEENTDGNVYVGYSWAQALLSSDYELLCRDGTRAPVSQWQRCHLVRVPFRGVVVREDITPSVVFAMLKEGMVRPHKLCHLTPTNTSTACSLATQRA